MGRDRTPQRIGATVTVTVAVSASASLLGLLVASSCVSAAQASTNSSGGGGAWPRPHPRADLLLEWGESQWRAEAGASLDDVHTFPPSMDATLSLGVHRERITRRSQWEAELAQWDEERVAREHFNNVSRRELRAIQSCNYAEGLWLHDPTRRQWYTSKSCKGIRSAYNCQQNGRKDTQYFQYRWRPFNCGMEQFDPHKFLSLVQGKVVGFVGDSIGRNLQQSINCMMSGAAISQPWVGQLGATKVYGEYYPQYSTRTYTVASPFLVKYSGAATAFEQYGMKAGPKYGMDSYVIWLDQPDPAWASLLPYTDLVIFVGSHWFLESIGDKQVRKDVFVSGGKVQKGVSGLAAYAAALRSIKAYVLKPKNFGGVVAFGTYTPSHYDNQRPPECPEMAPFQLPNGLALARVDQSSDFVGVEREIFRSTKVRLIDLTSVSIFRPDGHVKLFYGAPGNSHTKWDCLHWCLPGVPDGWGDVLQYVLRTQLWSFRIR